MSNAAQTIITFGLLGVGAYAVYQSRNGPMAAQPVAISYEPEPRRGRSLKDALLGGLAGALVESKGDTGSWLDRFLGGAFGGKQGAGGGTAAFVPQSEDYTRNPQSIGARLMGDLMRDFGLTRAQAAGVVGNLDHESGGFGHMQEISPTVKGSRGGYGYAQWTGPRRREFEAWAGKKGLEPSSYAANYGFLRHELTNTWEKRVIGRLRRTRDVDDATVVFQDTFLRPGIPHTESRKRRARRYA